MGVTVLGHFPLYARVSDELGARHLDIFPRHWSNWNSTQQWSENRYFLDRTLARNDRIVLTHAPRRAKPGSNYDRELRYLQSNGVVVTRFRDVHVLV